MNPNKIPTAALLHKWNPAFNIFFMYPVLAVISVADMGS